MMHKHQHQCPLIGRRMHNPNHLHVHIHLGGSFAHPCPSTKGGIIMYSAGRHAAVAVHETVHFHVAIAIAHHPFAGVVGVIAHHVDGSVGIGAR